MLCRCAVSFLLLGSTAFLSAQTSAPSFELSRDIAYVHSSQGYLTTSLLITGDFNGDQKPDLVEVGGATTTSLTLRLGNGDGTFQAPIAIGMVNRDYVTDIVAADVNRDGHLDLIVASESAISLTGEFDVYEGNGDGTFRPPVGYAVSNAPQSIAVQDFNGDGYPDVAIGDSYGGVNIWSNVSGNSFVMSKRVTPGNSSSEVMKVRAGQFDGDGINHLAAVVGNSIYVLWNDGKGNFNPVLLTSYPNVTDMSTGALNMDGRDDILLSYQCTINYSNNTQCGGISVFYGQGNQKMLQKNAVTLPNTLVVTSTRAYDTYPVSLWAVDLNGDGIGDIIAEPVPPQNPQNVPSGLYVWLGNPDGSFSQTSINYVPNTNGDGSLVPGDFNRDGMMDFAQTLPTNNEMEVYINGGRHAPCSEYTVSPSVTVCQPVDFTYLPSPVTVQANAFDTKTVTALQEYVDGKLDYSADVKNFTKAFAVGTGQHLFVTKAWDASGVQFVSDRRITVYSGMPGAACPVAAVNSAAICLPAGSTSHSPLQVLANGWTANVPTAAQLYVDGKLVVNNQACDSSGNNCDGGTSYVNTVQTLATGSHTLVFKLFDDLGGSYSAEKTITVQ